MKTEVATELVQRIVEMCKDAGCTTLVVGVQIDRADPYGEEVEPEIIYIRQVGDEPEIGKIRRMFIAMDYEDTSRLVTR